MRVGRRSIERPKITSGRMFRPNDPDEVVADITAARVMHLHAGSRLRLVGREPGGRAPESARDKRVDVRVVGIGVTRDTVVTVNALASAPTFLAGPAFAAQFGPADYAFDGAYVALPPRSDEARVHDDRAGVGPATSENGGQPLDRGRGATGRQG